MRDLVCRNDEVHNLFFPNPNPRSVFNDIRVYPIMEFQAKWIKMYQRLIQQVSQKPSCYHFLTEVFDGTIPSKILFPFPWNPYLKTDDRSLLNLFLVKNIKKKIEFLKERFCQKLPSSDDNNWAKDLTKLGFTPRYPYPHIFGWQISAWIFICTIFP